MDKPKKKKTSFKLLHFLIGYGLGFISWLGGLHCLVISSQGLLSLSYPRLRRHGFKVLMWTLELGLLWNILAVYRVWLMGATPMEIELAFLVKLVIFLYIKIFWPRVFPTILPGMHVFFCPQCYQRKTFRFMPVSFQFGFGVSYLCGYCSCLVNGWGEQIFYPVHVSLKKVIPFLMQTIPVVAVSMGLGILGFETIWKGF